MSPESVEAARRLWARERVETVRPEDVTAAIERLSTRLRLGLGRWIGFEGYRVLLERVVSESVERDPALGGLRHLLDGENKIPKMVSAQDVPAVTRGFVSVVALLIHSLSQVIGEDMAVRLVEQAWIASPRDESTHESQGASDV